MGKLLAIAIAIILATSKIGTVPAFAEDGLRPVSKVNFDRDREKTGFELDPNRDKAAIRTANIAYFKSKWKDGKQLVALIIKYAPEYYDEFFFLEDEKMPEFLDTMIANEMLKRGINQEEATTIIRINLWPIMHILQSIYFHSQGKTKQAIEAYDEALGAAEDLTLRGLYEYLIFDLYMPSDVFYFLAERIYRMGCIDFDRAYFLYRLGLSFFTIEQPTRFLPDDFARGIEGLNLWVKGERGPEVLGPVLAETHNYAAEIYPSMISQDTEHSRRLNAHFEKVKQEIMRASNRVKQQGAAVVLGGGHFSGLPLKKMLRETLPDGSIKYRKIVLIELARGLSERALKKLVDKHEITHDEAGRVEIIKADATLILDRAAKKIDELMKSGIEEKAMLGKEFPIQKVLDLYEEISDPKKIINYVLPIDKRLFEDNSANFVVFSMAIQDFAHSIKDYVDLWKQWFPLDEEQNKLLE
ncbi:MAG: hypothetical protein V2A72_00640 [Candidatus Omnitrophota bacterium]